MRSGSFVAPVAAALAPLVVVGAGLVPAAEAARTVHWVPATFPQLNAFYFIIFGAYVIVAVGAIAFGVRNVGLVRRSVLRNTTIMLTIYGLLAAASLLCVVPGFGIATSGDDINEGSWTAHAVLDMLTNACWWMVAAFVQWIWLITYKNHCDRDDYEVPRTVRIATGFNEIGVVILFLAFAAGGVVFALDPVPNNSAALIYLITSSVAFVLYVVIPIVYLFVLLGSGTNKYSHEAVKLLGMPCLLLAEGFFADVQLVFTGGQTVEPAVALFDYQIYSVATYTHSALKHLLMMCFAMGILMYMRRKIERKRREVMAEMKRRNAMSRRKARGQVNPPMRSEDLDIRKRQPEVKSSEGEPPRARGRRRKRRKQGPAAGIFSCCGGGGDDGHVSLGARSSKEASSSGSILPSYSSYRDEYDVRSGSGSGGGGGGRGGSRGGGYGSYGGYETSGYYSDSGGVSR